MAGVAVATPTGVSTGACRTGAVCAVARGTLRAVDLVPVAPVGRIAVDDVSALFVTEGWAHFEHAEGAIRVTAGSIITIPPRARVAVNPFGYLRYTGLHVDEEFLASQLPWLPVTHPLIAHLHAARLGAREPSVLHIGEDTMRRLRSRLSLLCTLSRTPGEDLAVLAQLAGLLHDLEHAGSLDVPRRLFPHRAVLRAATALHEGLERSWTITDLARLASISESQLSRLFRHDLGTSPAAYLSQLRADRMAELLLASDATIAAIAQQVGWASPSAASRAFRRRYGMSPRTFALRSRLSDSPGAASAECA